MPLLVWQPGLVVCFTGRGRVREDSEGEDNSESNEAVKKRTILKLLMLICGLAKGISSVRCILELDSTAK